MTSNYQQILANYVDSLPDKAKAPYGAIAARFIRFAEGRQLNADTVRTWDKRLKDKEHMSDGTRRKTWGVLHRLFAVNEIPWPFKRGDAPVIKQQSVYAPALAALDIHHMVDVVLGRRPSQGPASTEEHRCFLAIATTWGCRREEMSTMQPDYIDTKAGLLFVATAKKGRERYHIIPDAVMPHLQAWGFTKPESPDRLSALFNELKAMVALARLEDVGWHSIRRSLTKELLRAGLSEADVGAYMRWGRSSSNMVLRYGGSMTVGSETEEADLGVVDRELDKKILAVHPFLPWWSQI